MVMIKDSKGKEKFSVSTASYNALKRMKEKTNKEDSQVLGIFWGDVGSGKSLKAQHWGYVVDPKLDIKRVAFDKDEFINAVLDSKKRVIIGDEGISLFFSRASMTKEGRLMSEIMDQIRQKNLCVFICVPKLLTMDWTILESANFVAYVWENQVEKNGRLVTQKGNIAFYPRLASDDYKMRIINYLKSKKRNPDYKKPRPAPLFTEPGNPIGDSFKKPWYPVGELHYRRKKESILEKYRKPDKTKVKESRGELLSILKTNNPKLTDEMLANGFKISREWANKLRNAAVKRI